MSGKIRTGIMGGTFDPIHNAHLIIAQYAAEQFALDTVWFMTSGNPPHKADRKVTDAHVRQTMTAEAIKGNERFELCSYEVDKDRFSYTAETLTSFCETYPDREFYFIIGADSLDGMAHWYRPHIIAEKCVILVYGRRGTDDLDALVKDRTERFSADIRVIDAPMIDISSSVIRERVRCGRNIRYMVPREVDEYIRSAGLYREM